MPKKISKAKARDLCYQAQRKMLKIAQETRDISTHDYNKAMKFSNELRAFANRYLR